jgi:hypothetical protein
MRIRPSKDLKSGGSRTLCLQRQNIAKRAKIPGKDGGWLKEDPAFSASFTQDHMLRSRRWAHRRTVDESGKRDGSLQCGAACST